MELYQDIGLYYDLNMNPIDTKSLITTHLHIPSTPFNNIFLDGTDGMQPLYNGVNIEQKEIKAEVVFVAYDFLDYQLLRDELYSIFGFGKPFYLVDKRQSSKRHKVILESNFMPTRHNAVLGTMEINFITCDLPYAESIGTTADIDKHGLLYSQELWSYGMGLSYDDETHKYTHNTNIFHIYNAGNVGLHPFQHDMKIMVKGAQKGYKLTNETTGDVFEYKGQVNGNILLDGPNITVNGLQAFRDTNHKFITLSNGWNEFVQNQSCEVEFDFRFYYL